MAASLHATAGRRATGPASGTELFALPFPSRWVERPVSAR